MKYIAMTLGPICRLTSEVRSKGGKTKCDKLSYST